jgi:ferredoxin--NADP+ reductase
MERTANATIVSRADANERLAVLRVRHDLEPVADFVPGQFVRIGLPRTEDDADAPGREGEVRRRVRFDSRAYSIASSPFDKDGYELVVALVREGRLTPRLWELREGGRCWLDPRPLGSFTLESVGSGSHLLLVATGTGSVPYVSMVRTYARGRPLHSADRWRTCTIVHGVRVASDLVHRAELEALAGVDPTLRYLPTVSREPEASDWRGLRGRVDLVLEGAPWEGWGGEPFDRTRWHVFLCGNPDMIAGMRARLAALDLESIGHLHVERYW